MNIETRALTRWISEREFYRVDERNDKKIFQLSTYTRFWPSKRIGYAYKSSIVQILKTHLNPLARSTIMLHNNWHSIRNMWPFTATHLLVAILYLQHNRAPLCFRQPRLTKNTRHHHQTQNRYTTNATIRRHHGFWDQEIRIRRCEWMGACVRNISTPCTSKKV